MCVSRALLRQNEASWIHESSFANISCYFKQDDMQILLITVVKDVNFASNIYLFALTSLFMCLFIYLYCN